MSALSRAGARSHETAIRRALGASRWRLLRGLLVEGLLLSTIGATLGLLLAYFGIQAIRAWLPPNIPRVASIGIGWWSDVLADAMAGEGPFAGRDPATDLRVLFAGHVDAFTLVAHQGSGIRTVEDLRGKRIGIGSPGSRQGADMEGVMAALGLTRDEFAEVRELSPAEQNRAFCANELDAIVYSVSHPNGLIRDATLTCHGMLVAVSGPAIDRMLSEYQEYERATIPGGTYPANPTDVPTFGVRAVVARSEANVIRTRLIPRPCRANQEIRHPPAPDRCQSSLITRT